MEVKVLVTLDLTDAMKERGIDKLSQHEISLFEYFVEKQVEDYNPQAVISRLELKPDEPLSKIFREGFDVIAELD
jgi:hypothetical protein